MTDFDLFWEHYPRKVNKPLAQRTWKKLEKQKELPPVAIILNGVSKLKAEIRHLKTEKKYIPHPSTWLNNHGWVNEYQTGSYSKPRPRVQPRIILLNNALEIYKKYRDRFDLYCENNNFTKDEKESVIATHEVKKLAGQTLKEA